MYKNNNAHFILHAFHRIPLLRGFFENKGLRYYFSFLLFSFLLFSFLTCFAQRSQEEQLAIQYYQQGEFEKAKAILKPLFDKKPDAYTYSYYYAVLLQWMIIKSWKKRLKRSKKHSPIYEDMILIWGIYLNVREI